MNTHAPPKDSTELGIVTELNPQQLQKAEDSIVVTEFGIWMVFKASQLSKAERPMILTELGIVTEIIDEHPKNA